MKFTTISNLKPGMRIGQNLIGIYPAETNTIGYTLSEHDIAFLTEKGYLEAQETPTEPPKKPARSKKKKRAIVLNLPRFGLMRITVSSLI